jgi:hypothetical protein
LSPKGDRLVILAEKPAWTMTVGKTFVIALRHLVEEDQQAPVVRLSAEDPAGAVVKVHWVEGLLMKTGSLI